MRASPKPAGRVVALVASDERLAAPVREGVAKAYPEAIFVSTVTEAIRVCETVAVDLVVCDVSGGSPGELIEAIGAEGAPPLLAVLEPGAGTELDHVRPEFEPYIARPLHPEALAAVCRDLLERAAPRRLAGSDPELQLRRPLQFSARPLYADAVAYSREAFRLAETGQVPDMAAARMIAERLHTSLHQNNLLLIRALEPYKLFELPTHCTNVAIVSAKIAMGLDFSLERTLKVIQAGLVHDIGMARLPYAILEKAGPLTDEERRDMQRHPELGADLIDTLGADFSWLTIAIRQEHERAGGQGYPDGRRAPDIDEIAQILGVADVFEAFSHSRHYRSPFTAFEALERVLDMRNEHFAPRVVDALSNEISVFPLDSYVRLSSGEIGRVVATNPANLMRPAIEVLWSESWAPLAEPELIRLDARPEIAIERPLHESEVPIT